MDKFTVTGIPAFNGDYPVDITSFTMRELQIIKRMSGVRGGELTEAFQAGDTDLILAIAVIAVRRSGKDWQAFEQIAWESDMGAISFVVDEAAEEEEAADEPVPLTQRLEPVNGSDDAGSSSEQHEPSGPLSHDDGADPQETNLRAIGAQH